MITKFNHRHAKSFLAVSFSALTLYACEATPEQEIADTTAPILSEEVRAESEQVAVNSSQIKQSKSSRFHSTLPSPIPNIVPNIPANTERYDNGEANPVKLATKEPLSTFSADVDSASYSIGRRFIMNNNSLPPSEAVRVEELVNYFTYDYKKASSAEEPFAPTVWVTPSPWSEDKKLMHIGVQGYDTPQAENLDANIVLLLDVSGSMSNEDKLPLVKKSIKLMLNELDENDTISIVVYAGAAGVVLEPTAANQKTKILKALNNLNAGGSTAGGQGISLAYDLAEENFSDNKVNRILLATDGDFNVGTVDDDSLEDFVARKRKSGIYLTILGFGQGNYNDVLAQKLAQAGNGVAAYVDNLNEARKVLVNEFTSTLFPIAKDLKFQVEFNPAVVAEYRLIGYETRALNNEDFNNDAVDAGDIGAGHTVTALYELSLNGSNSRLVDDLRYGKKPAINSDLNIDELAFVKLRYKLPDQDKSNLITMPVMTKDIYQSLEDAPIEARFASSVAAFGQKLARSKFTHDIDYEQIINLAQANKGDDPYGYRSEFVQIVRAAEKIDQKG